MVDRIIGRGGEMRDEVVWGPGAGAEDFRFMEVGGETVDGAFEFVDAVSVDEISGGKEQWAADGFASSTVAGEGGQRPMNYIEELRGYRLGLRPIALGGGQRIHVGSAGVGVCGGDAHFGGSPRCPRR